MNTYNTCNVSNNKSNVKIQFRSLLDYFSLRCSSVLRFYSSFRAYVLTRRVFTLLSLLKATRLDLICHVRFHAPRGSN